MYSLTSEPDRADGCISITPKLVEVGNGSHLVRAARPGSIVRLGGVEGTFVLLPDKLLFQRRRWHYADHEHAAVLGGAGRADRRGPPAFGPAAARTSSSAPSCASWAGAMTASACTSSTRRRFARPQSADRASAGPAQWLGRRQTVLADPASQLVGKRRGGGDA